MKAALSVKALVSRTGLPARGGELAMAAGCEGGMNDGRFLSSGGGDDDCERSCSLLLKFRHLLGPVACGERRREVR